MTSKDELKQLLRDFSREEDVAHAKQTASEFLRDVDARTLSLAEQELMAEGIGPERLRSLCEVHLQVLEATPRRQIPAQDEPSPVGILTGEHEVILQHLEELRTIAEQLDGQPSEAERERCQRLDSIARLLLDAESHHKREEETLFPRLERHGITGPPAMMRLEHEDLRANKRRLAELVGQLAADDGNLEVVRQIKQVAGYIVEVLRSHIFKEDNILYPIALDALTPEEWDEISREFDDIGYCSFTPSRV